MLPVGEVVEIILKNGAFAYVQYVGKGTYGGGSTLIRILEGEFDRPLSATEIESLVSRADRYRIYSTLPYGTLDERMHRRGRFPIPDKAEISPILRRMLRPSERNPDGWAIIDSDGVQSNGKDFAMRHPDIDQRNLSVAAAFDRSTTLQMLDEGWHPALADHDSIGI